MKQIFTGILLFLCIALSGAPIGQKRAQEVASSFFKNDVLTRSSTMPVRLVWAGDQFPQRGDDVSSTIKEDDALMYIYNSTAGKGYVIVSGESGTRPVIAYSHDFGFDINNMSPATRAILDGWCRQLKACRDSSENLAEVSDDSGVGRVVVKYETALWGQNEPYNWEAPVVDGNLCVTGCVATAMAIIAHFNRYPHAGVGTTPEYTWEGMTVPENHLGRAYDYDNMLMDYRNDYTSEQGMAVAALMKDFGTAVQMLYSPIESSAYSHVAYQAFSKYFGYSKNAVWQNATGFAYSEWLELMKKNLLGYGPMFYRGTSQAGGHAFVIDGYTDMDYFSINYGWNGYNNGYYLLPSIEFYSNQGTIFDMAPDMYGTTQYVDNLSMTAVWYGDIVVSGLKGLDSSYKKDVPFRCYVAAISNDGLADFTGSIALAHCDVDGNIKSYLQEYHIENLQSFYNFNLSNEPITLCLKENVSVGDNVRVLYKGTNSSDWKFMRATDGPMYAEMIISVPPQQLAPVTELKYVKSEKTLCVGGVYHVNCTLEGEGGSVSADAAPQNWAVMDVSGIPSGEYKLSVSAGAEPFVVNIVF